MTPVSCATKVNRMWFLEPSVERIVNHLRGCWRREASKSISVLKTLNDLNYALSFIGNENKIFEAFLSFDRELIDINPSTNCELLERPDKLVGT